MAQQTAVEWLYIKMYTHRGNITVEEYEQAKQMEKKQIENARPQVISNCNTKEIADEDIKRGIKKEYTYSNYQDRHWMVEGAKWYRKELKKAE